MGLWYPRHIVIGAPLAGRVGGTVPVGRRRRLDVWIREASHLRPRRVDEEARLGSPPRPGCLDAKPWCDGVVEIWEDLAKQQAVLARRRSRVRYLGTCRGFGCLWWCRPGGAGPGYPARKRLRVGGSLVLGSKFGPLGCASGTGAFACVAPCVSFSCCRRPWCTMGCCTAPSTGWPRLDGARSRVSGRSSRGGFSDG